MDDLEEIEEVLVSLVSAALTAAKADAARTGEFTWDPAWEPTPRTRKTTRPRQSSSWLREFILSRLPADLSEPLRSQQAPPAPPPSGAPPASAPPPSHSRGAAFPAPPSVQAEPQENLVDKLVEENRDAYTELINHTFPRALGDGSAPLDGFRYYMIQDTLYLEICARLKMSAVARAPTFEDIKNFIPRHQSSLEYVRKSKETLVTKLGVPEKIIDSTKPSKELEASEEFYVTYLQKDDPYFAYYIILLPCVMSYWQIANHLVKQKLSAENVVYHEAWTEVNDDESSVKKYKKFINANIKAKGGIDKWKDIFGTACKLESGIFNTGWKHPAPYQIVPKGTYSIQNAESVVLANVNVENFLRSPSGRLLAAYFPSDPGSSIVGVNSTACTGADNEKWDVDITMKGYTFRNVGTKLYLGIATESGRKEYRVLKAVAKPHYWWINPYQNQPSQGSPLHQIFESTSLRYTLHADVEVLKSVNHGGSHSFSHTPVVSCENSKQPCQMWSFEKPGVPKATKRNETREERKDDEKVDARSETKPEPPKDAPKDGDKATAHEKLVEKMAELVEKYAQVLQEGLRRGRNEEPQRERHEKRQEPPREAQRDSGKMDASREAAKMNKWVEKYVRVLREEIEAVNQMRKERTEEIVLELLQEARMDANRVTANEDVTWKMANLFGKYEPLLQEEFEAFEELRKERNEKIREDLLTGARKDVDKLVANQEVNEKMAELFKKYEQMLQEELEAVDQLRKDRNEGMKQELLKRAQKDVNRVGAGEVTKKMVEKYGRTLQEDVEADEQTRKECNEEMIRKLLKEAREEIEKLVASVKRKVGFVEKYEQALREDFEAAEQLRNDRNEELRQELLEGERKSTDKTDPITEKAKVVVLTERYERGLQDEFDAIEQWRIERNENTKQELLREAQKDTKKVAANEDVTRRMAKLFEKYGKMLQEEFEAIEQLRKERNEIMRGELLREVQKAIDKKVASRKATAELVEKYERLLQADFEAVGQLRAECHGEVRQKLLDEAKLQKWRR